MAFNLPSDIEDDISDQVVIATTRSGIEKRFDTSVSICEEFGFYAGERVQTPRGAAWVIGVNNGDLYFSIDGDKGASKWVGCKKDDFKARGFRLLFSNIKHRRQQQPNQQPIYHAPHLKALINDSQFSDVCFLLDAAAEAAPPADDDSNSSGLVKVYAMRGLLVSRCEYFRSLFSRVNGMEESKLTEVRLHSVSPACFLLILEYVYCGVVTYQVEQAAELLRTADLFLLFDLRNECAAFLNKRISQQNCIELLQLADQFNLDNLRIGCLDFLTENLQSHPGLRRQWLELVQAQPELSLLLIDRLCARLNPQAAAVAAAVAASSSASSSSSSSAAGGPVAGGLDAADAAASPIALAAPASAPAAHVAAASVSAAPAPATAAPSGWVPASSLSAAMAAHAQPSSASSASSSSAHSYFASSSQPSSSSSSSSSSSNSSAALGNDDDGPTGVKRRRLANPRQPIAVILPPSASPSTSSSSYSSSSSSAASSSSFFLDAAASSFSSFGGLGLSVPGALSSAPSSAPSALASASVAALLPPTDTPESRSLSFTVFPTPSPLAAATPRPRHASSEAGRPVPPLPFSFQPSVTTPTHAPPTPSTPAATIPAVGLAAASVLASSSSSSSHVESANPSQQSQLSEVAPSPGSVPTQSSQNNAASYTSSSQADNMNL